MTSSQSISCRQSYLVSQHWLIYLQSGIQSSPQLLKCSALSMWHLDHLGVLASTSQVLSIVWLASRQLSSPRKSCISSSWSSHSLQTVFHSSIKLYIIWLKLTKPPDRFSVLDKAVYYLVETHRASRQLFSPRKSWTSSDWSSPKSFTVIILAFYC